MANAQNETSSSTTETSKTAFSKLNADNDIDNGVTEIESVCMNCFKTGKTKLMLTRIPFYRDVIISSFTCEHCGYQNNAVQSANKIQDLGVKIKLLVKSQSDLNREIVKSDYALFKIPSVDFEIQPLTQKGMLTTIEGIIDRVITNLESDIDLRKDEDPDLAEKLKVFVNKLNRLKSLEESFEVILDDPSGDSFIENPSAPSKDPQLTVTHYKRTQEQNEQFGFDEQAVVEQEKETNEEEEVANENEDSDLKNEVCKFQGNCPSCNAICETNMKLTDIPYFKTVIIMCTICDACGIKNSEVKPGTVIDDKGIKFVLKITDPSDINRDLIKSEFATFEIPEIEFFMNSGTLGGKFTTIEGLLKDCREQLDDLCPFAAGGDSECKTNSSKLKECLDKLGLIQNGEMLDVTIILDDPSGNSYLQNVYAPDDDPNMQIIHYERDFDQNEMLGLNDMKTENYTNDDNTD